MDVKLLNGDLKFKFRVSAIVICDEKLLVNKYGDNSYCLPGGYVKIGETSRDAIIREMNEETGLEFEIIKFAGVTENFFTNLRSQKTHGVDFYYYLGIKKDDKLNLDYVENDNGFIIEHHYSWIPLGEVEKYNILPHIIKNNLKKEEIFHFIITD